MNTHQIARICGVTRFGLAIVDANRHDLKLVWAPRDCLRQTWQRHITIGEARREVQRVHWCHLIDWMHQQVRQGATPQTVSERLAA